MEQENQYISITGIKYRTRKTIRTSSDFFKNNLTVHIDSDKIIFTDMGDLYNGKTLTIGTWRNFYQTTLNLDIEDGKYLINKEDSTEDKIIIYFDERQ